MFMVVKSEQVTQHAHRGQALFQQPDDGAVADRDLPGSICISSVGGRLVNGVVSFRGSHFSPF